MSIWRNQDYIDNLKKNLSYEQYKRFQKISNEQFYVLQIIREQLKFKISGSTQNVYSIHIDKNLGTFHCDCPDAKSHCIYKKCLCKHIVFLLIRILKYYDIDIYKNLKFDNENFLPFLNKIENSYIDDISLTNLSLTDKYNLKINNEDNDVLNDPFKSYKHDEDYECVICYDILGVELKLVGCPTCKQSFHEDCLHKWLQNSNYKNCVYCRSNVWKVYKKNGKHEEYINLL